MSYTKQTWATGDVITAEKLNHIEDGIEDAGSGGGSSEPISITYSALKALRDNGNLVPGAQYRITDYVCTTTQEESRAVSHPFDIIVTADAANKLSEDAKACLHAGDTYYSGENSKADLSKWELKYCIDNDATKYLWADTTNGKGVVYYMKDENGNVCPYDFKQIQFARYKITEMQYHTFDEEFDYFSKPQFEDATYPSYIISLDEENPEWFYTFSYKPETPEEPIPGLDLSVVDRSVFSRFVYNPDPDEGRYDDLDASANVMDEYIDEKEIGDDEWVHGQFLNNNVFVGYVNADNSLLKGCHHNTICIADCITFSGANNNFISEMGNNVIGPAFSANVVFSMTNSHIGRYFSNNFVNSFDHNTIEDSCSGNVFDAQCIGNTIGESFYNNTIDGTIFSHNNISYSVSGNSFKGFNNNQVADNFKDNTFAGDAVYSVFGDNFKNNTFNGASSYNVFGGHCSRNTFGNDFSHNKLGYFFYNNTFGYSCENNTFDHNCQSNNIGNHCAKNAFGCNCTGDTLGESCETNSIGANCSAISLSNSVVKFTLMPGTSGTPQNPIVINRVTNDRPFCGGLNTAGVFKTWVPADLVP